MQPIITFLISRFKKLDQKRSALHDRAILALELIFLRTLETKKPTVKDAISSASKIIQAHVFLPELYFLVFGILLITFSSGTFVEQGVDYGTIRPVIFAISCLFAGTLAIALAYVTAPLHLLLGFNLWILTGVHVLLTATAFSALQPYVAHLFLDKGIADFNDLLIPSIIFFGITEFYLLFRLRDAVIFQNYSARHATPSIDNIIPPDIQGPLISMSSQDHYLEIVTEMGRHLSRQTMAKAIAMVPKNTGLQVHRSHWVAYAAIDDLKKSSVKFELLLKNGKSVPVGKAKTAEVQAFLDTR